MYLVSACLAGINCRYDGKNNLDTEILKLVNEGKAIPVCPEQLGGLTTPRIACEMQSFSNQERKIINKDGIDKTYAFALGAERTLAIAKALGIKKAILKAKSPSCGCGTIYDGSFTKQLIDGDGVTAAVLKANGITIISR